jgi:hypothetical protein
MQEPQVVAACPVLHDLVMLDAPDVDERPGHFDASRLGPREQRHRRCSVHAPQSHVVGYELALGDEMVVLDFAVAKVMADDVEDLPQSLSALRPRGVVDHVLGHEVVEDVVVPGEPSSEELFYHRLRFCHPPRLPATRSGLQHARSGLSHGQAGFSSVPWTSAGCRMLEFEHRSEA